MSKNKSFCNHCGNELKNNSKFCEKCGKSLKKPFYKKTWFWIIIGFVFLLIVFSNNESTESNTPSSTNNQTNKTITYEEVDIDELEETLENNAAAAKDTYNGKYLIITGRLGTIDSDLKYISLLSTTDEWDIIGVHCTIKNKETKEVVKSLTKDQVIKVKGKITDVGEVLGYYLDIDEIITE